MNVRGNAEVADTPSYHAAWAGAVRRFWHEDQLRMEWLNQQLAIDRRVGEARAQVLPDDVRERKRAGARRWAAKERHRKSIPCPKCGNLMDKAASSCLECRMPDKPTITCACGTPNIRWRRSCRTCRAPLGTGR